MHEDDKRHDEENMQNSASEPKELVRPVVVSVTVLGNSRKQYFEASAHQHKPVVPAASCRIHKGPYPQVAFASLPEFGNQGSASLSL